MSLLDVPPTLLEIAGVEPLPQIQGISLAASVRDGRDELYDLDRDPGERRASAEGPHSEALRQAVAGLSREPPVLEEAVESQLDPELQEQLRALGYVR